MGKKKLLEPREARLGAVFYGVLTHLHENPDHPSAEYLNEEFANNREVVVQTRFFKQFGDGKYKEKLPADAKSFVSRCASYKRHNKEVTMKQIVREQYALVVRDSERLHREVMNLMDRGYRDMVWPRIHQAMLTEWYEIAGRDPLHMYHPEEIPDEYLKTNLLIFG